jgi:hypothetical protein
LMVLPNVVVVVLIAVAAAFTTLSVYVIVIAALRNWLNRFDGLDDGVSAICLTFSGYLYAIRWG